MEKQLLTKGTPVLYQNRYCDLENFDLVISGQHFDYDTYSLENLNSTKYPELTSVSTLDIDLNYNDKVLTSCSSIWIIRTKETKNNDPSTMNAGSYGVPINTVQMPDLRKLHCACSFMKYLYVFSGVKDLNYDKLSTSIKYSCKTGKWNYIASLKTERYSAACTVFDGKIVVSGGFNNYFGQLSSVESYDHHENKWTNLPDMIEARDNHAAVSNGDKMFVIGGDDNLTSEAFDIVSRKFTCIKQLIIPETFTCTMYAVSIGYKIIVFPRLNGLEYKKCLNYDVLTDKWETKEIELVSTRRVHSCSRLPIF